jgi:oligosaccharyltransferase complex subunit alpha (ribophorin I)
MIFQVQLPKEDTTSVPVIKDRPLPMQTEAAVYRISIPSLLAGSSATIVVELTLFKAIVPFPSEITQSENQLVKFMGNSYLFSPYPTKTQSTTFTLPNSNIESFNRVAPTSSADQTLTYGPYSDMAPFSYGKVDIHFENNGPFLTVVELERIIEVSHWGNIAVEEYIHIRHIGK